MAKWAQEDDLSGRHDPQHEYWLTKVNPGARKMSEKTKHFAIKVLRTLEKDLYRTRTRAKCELDEMDSIIENIYDYIDELEENNE